VKHGVTPGNGMRPKHVLIPARKAEQNNAQRNVLLMPDKREQVRKNQHRVHFEAVGHHNLRSVREGPQKPHESRGPLPTPPKAHNLEQGAEHVVTNARPGIQRCVENPGRKPQAPHGALPGHGRARGKSSRNKKRSIRPNVHWVVPPLFSQPRDIVVVHCRARETQWCTGDLCRFWQ